jgi:hypothetical protein
MTLQELVARFPEIPEDLHEEPLLAQFGKVFGEQLRVAQNPGACSTAYSAGNHYYLKLIGPMRIYMYGLSSREKVLAQLQELLARHRTDPVGLVAGLVPQDTADREARGPGCE